MFFNFTASVPTGGIAGLNVIKSTRDTQETLLRTSTFVKREAEYFQENIAKVNSAEELVDDSRLLRVALEAYGLGDEFSKKAYIRQVLESDLSNPRSMANRIGDSRWQDFAKAFVKAEVSVPQPLNSGFGAKISVGAYSQELGKYVTDAQITAIDTKADKFREVMKNITTTDQLFMAKNKDALNFIKEAFGLTQDTASNEQIAGYLNAPNEYALNEDDSPVVPDAWKEARATLSFYNETYVLGTDAVTDKKSNSTKVIEEVVLGRYRQELSEKTGHFAYEQKKTEFIADMKAITSVDDFLANTSAVQFVKEAYNLINDTTDTATVKTYLTSPTDAGVPDAWKAVREKLGFYEVDPLENITTTMLNTITKRHEDFNVGYLDNIAKFNRFKKEADYFELSIGLVSSNQDIVADGRTLRFALSASGLGSESLNSQKALKVLEGDYEFKNTTTDAKWREFRNNFSFSVAENNLKTEEDNFSDKIIEDFIDNSFLEAVGEQDPNLRLALYFEKRMGELAKGKTVDEFGWFKVIGETPLATVFQTALNLPSSFGQLDIEKQAEIYALRTERVAGSSQLSAFKDKDYMDNFVQRYLLQASVNENNSGSNPVLSLLG